jgi:hypothetical protein
VNYPFKRNAELTQWSGRGPSLSIITLRSSPVHIGGDHCHVEKIVVCIAQRSRVLQLSVHALKAFGQHVARYCKYVYKKRVSNVQYRYGKVDSITDL